MTDNVGDDLAGDLADDGGRGAAQVIVKVQTEDFDAGAEIAALSKGRGDVGAVASFVGLVRDRAAVEDAAGSVTALELEHYPGMTEKALAEIAEEACARWPLSAAAIVHRYGPLAVGDQIVLAAAASAHRGAALEACAFLMDYLKTKAPFWKRETGPDGSGGWVEARDADDAAAERWRGD